MKQTEGGNKKSRTRREIEKTQRAHRQNNRERMDKDSFFVFITVVEYINSK